MRDVNNSYLARRLSKRVKQSHLVAHDREIDQTRCAWKQKMKPALHSIGIEYVRLAAGQDEIIDQRPSQKRLAMRPCSEATIAARLAPGMCG